MPKSSKSKSTPKQLLVEGNSDKQVIDALCKQHQISGLFSFSFPTRGGIENLIQNLPRKLEEPNLMTLGIVADADRDVAARWQAITNKLRELGYNNIPKIIPETGWIYTPSLEEEKPTIGVWLMPDNQLPGMLEDFVKYLIPSDDKLKDKAEAILKEIETEKINAYSSKHRQKAFIHTWLAWQEDPGRPMGQAITKKVLSSNSEIAKIFVQWLTDLFAD